jgi:hypothetical protein
MQQIAPYSQSFSTVNKRTRILPHMTDWPSGATSGEYDLAQICERGHIITAFADTQPGLRASRCSKCGSVVIEKCPDCQAPLRGAFYGTYSVQMLTEAPKYCHQCGAAYPWRAEQLRMAEELAAEAQYDLDEKEQGQLRDSLVEISTDTAATQLAGARIKRLLNKVSEPLKAAIYKYAVDVSSEIGKKILTGE